LNILVVGQTPPPWGGQAVMIQKLLDSRFEGLSLHHVPMVFSSDMDEIGRFRWRKIIRLPLLVIQIWRDRFRYSCSTLYYPPGGESVTSVFRDIVVLLCCRALFKKVIFHVHAGGFAAIADSAPFPIRLLARWAYCKPDLVIQLTEKSPPDGMQIHARKVVFVPNGLADEAAKYLRDREPPVEQRPVALLFVGVVSPGKGVRVLLKACSHLLTRRVDFSLKVMGRFYSPEFEAECRAYIRDQGLSPYVDFVGVKVGSDKWNAFCKSDIFCFPSHFESENQSLVVLEAMQSGLPCVASDWRGMSTMITEGETGYLVPVEDDICLAARIEALVGNPALRLQMGAKARSVFLNDYTDTAWRERMEKVLKDELIGVPESSADAGCCRERNK